jgi:type II secretory pathway pseudopilin PulG
MVELLVVIGIIALLSALLLGAIARVRELSRRTRCSANQSQIAKGAGARAAQDPLGIYIPTFSVAEHNLGYLFADRTLTDPGVTVCPSTDNVARDSELVAATTADPWGLDPSPGGLYARLWARDIVPLDTVRAAADSRDNSGGHSYAVWAWYFAGQWPDGNVVDSGPRDANPQRGFGARDPVVAARAPTSSSALLTGGHVLKTNRLPYGQDSKILLTSDRMAGTVAGFPDLNSNHGEFGTAVSYLDGHAEWIETATGVDGGRTLLSVYLGGYVDVMAANPTFWTTNNTGYSRATMTVPNSGSTLPTHTF